MEGLPQLARGQVWVLASPHGHLGVHQPPQAPGSSRAGRRIRPSHSAHSALGEIPLPPPPPARRAGHGGSHWGGIERSPLNAPKGGRQKKKLRRRKGEREQEREKHTCMEGQCSTCGRSRWRLRGMRMWGGGWDRGKGEEGKMLEVGGAESLPQVPGQVWGVQQQEDPKRSEWLGPSKHHIPLARGFRVQVGDRPPPCGAFALALSSVYTSWNEGLCPRLRLPRSAEVTPI